MVQTFSLEQEILVTRLRAAIYVRVSTKKQDDEGYSLDSQIEYCLRWCEEHGYDVVERHMYREVMSGVIYRERPLLTTLRLAARNHEFDVVVIYDFDRLAREDTHQTVIIQDLKENGVRVEAVKRNFEDTPAGRFLMHTYGFMAEVEREKILQRTADGRMQRALSHKLLGGSTAKYGYKFNNDRSAYLINDDVVHIDEADCSWTEAEVLRHIFALVVRRKSLRSIATLLTEQGFPTPKGGKRGWEISTLRWLLSDPFYIGQATLFKTKRSKDPDHPNGMIYRPAEEQIPLPDGVVPPLIDEETFQQVQVILQRNKALAARNNKNPEDALLRCGIAFCGYCGGKMVVNRLAYGTMYRCSKHTGIMQCKQKGSILVTTADQAAWEHAVEIINDPKLVAQKVKERQKKNPADNDLQHVDNELDRIAQEVANIMEISVKAPNKLVLQTASGLLNSLEQERLRFEKMRNDLLNIEEMKRKEQQALLQFEQKCAVWRKKLKDPESSFTYYEKREAIEFFGIKALVWRAEDKPRLKITSDPLSIVFSAS